MTNSERRGEERAQAIELLRYYDYVEVRGKTVPTLNFALTTDVSTSGVSFRSLKPVDNDLRLMLVNYDLWENPREGVVKWCSECSPGIYRVGVSLLF